MAGAKKVSLRRVLAVLFGVLVAVYLGGLLWVHIETWKSARDFVGDTPSIRVPLQPVRQTGTADIQNGTRLQAFGYVMQFPWPEEGSKVKISGTSATVTWPKRSFVLFSDPGTGFATAQARTLEALYGNGTPRSAYDWTEMSLASTGSDVGFFHTDKANFRAIMMGVEKVSLASGFYKVAAGEMRGFQEGEPSRDKLIKLVLFDSQDREVEILLTRPADGVLTQEQINAVIASVHPLEAPGSR